MIEYLVGYLHLAIKEMYQGATTSLSIQGGNVENFPTTISVYQGSTLILSFFSLGSRLA